MTWDDFSCHFRHISRWFRRSRAIATAHLSMGGAEAECVTKVPVEHTVELRTLYNTPLWRVLLRRPMTLTLSQPGLADRIYCLPLGAAGEWQRITLQATGGAVNIVVRDSRSATEIGARRWEAASAARAMDWLRVAHEALAVRGAALPTLHLLTPDACQAPTPGIESLEYSLVLADAEDPALTRLLLSTLR